MFTCHYCNYRCLYSLSKCAIIIIIITRIIIHFKNLIVRVKVQKYIEHQKYSIRCGIHESLIKLNTYNLELYQNVNVLFRKRVLFATFKF